MHWQPQEHFSPSTAASNIRETSACPGTGRAAPLAGVARRPAPQHPATVHVCLQTPRCTHSTSHSAAGGFFVRHLQAPRGNAGEMAGPRNTSATPHLLTSFAAESAHPLQTQIKPPVGGEQGRSCLLLEGPWGPHAVSAACRTLSFNMNPGNQHCCLVVSKAQAFPALCEGESRGWREALTARWRRKAEKPACFHTACKMPCPGLWY